MGYSGQYGGQWNEGFPLIVCAADYVRSSGSINGGAVERASAES